MGEPLDTEARATDRQRKEWIAEMMVYKKASGRGVMATNRSN